MEIERFTRKPVVWISVTFGIVAVVLAIYFSRTTPQIGTDEQVFKTVDALFTAITSKDAKRLEDCEVKLKASRLSGTLPVASSDRITSIIDEARTGKWDSSARRLYDFMRAQKRE